VSTATIDDVDLEDVEAGLREVEDDETSAPSVLVEEEALTEEAKDFVHQLVNRILLFMDALVGHALYPYQQRLAYRIVESSSSTTVLRSPR
jgi:hypothetical protein